MRHPAPPLPKSCNRLSKAHISASYSVCSSATPGGLTFMPMMEMAQVGGLAEVGEGEGDRER